MTNYRCKTKVRVVNQSLYALIPAAIIKSPSYEPCSEYDIEIDANGVITLSPLTLTDSQE